ncbi:MAG: LacI family DNA-binding transcriptional regulator [Clostridia bacterium]|jgi:DNA-binding LacI/PurR family transcriptional regulator|nr:LacI family DNA-binding transcriptional regulator [Clostridia bacterium]
MRVTIKDIANMSGVSVATASMALNDRPGINKDTKKKVLEVANKLHYRPNHSARSLITKKSGCIGLIVTSIRNPFFSKLVDVFNKEVEAMGYSLLLGITNDKIKLEKKYIDLFIERNVEGLIIVPTIEKSPDLTQLYMLKSMHIPFVFCTTAYYGLKADVVMTDLMEGEYQMVKYLIEKGKRNIYFVTCDQSLMLSSLRLDGFKKAHADAGLSFSNDQIIETVPDYDHGYKTGIELSKLKPDAVVAINDFLAWGITKAFKDCEISIPQDVSVAGYDDLLYSSLFEPALTTVKQPITQICKKTLEVLVKNIEDDTQEAKTYYISPKMMVRDST